MKDCQKELQEKGLPYPRSCPVCGLTGPCKREVLDAEIKRLSPLYWQAHYKDDDVKASEIRCEIEELESELAGK